MLFYLDTSPCIVLMDYTGSSSARTFLFVLSSEVVMGQGQSTPNESHRKVESPQLSRHPKDKTNAIKTATFTTEATGTDLNYQWERRPPGEGGDDWQPMPTDDDRIEGANTPELGITHLQKSDEGSYRCTVTNRAGRIVSSPALLTLVEPPQLPRHPKDQTNAIKTATFATEATGTDLNYLWERRPPGEGDDWQPMPTDDDRIKGANMPELGITHLLKSDEGSYRCTVTNRAGRVVSSPALLTLVDPVKIISQPQDNRNVAPKTTMKLPVIATGRETLKYTWEWNPDGDMVVDSAQKKAIEGEAASSAIRSHFDKLCKQITPEDVVPALYAKKIINKREMNEATNKYLNVEDRVQALLQVLMRNVHSRPHWFHQICNILYAAHVASTQDVRDEYQRKTKEAEGWKPIPSDGGRYEGVHTATLTITRVQRSDQGGYRCIVYNDTGSETSEPAVVTVAEPPRITSHPQHQQEVVPGTEVNFSVQVTGTENLQYLWMWRPLESAKDAWLPAGGNCKEVQGADTPTLTISAAHESHQGRYRCIVSNRVGSETSNLALLSLAEPPKIKSHPKCENEVLTQETITFSVEVDGPGSHGYSWMFKPAGKSSDEQLKDGDQFQGTATPVLSIANVQKSNSGSYQCVVTNGAGMVISNAATLKVLSPDDIIYYLRDVCKDESALADKTTAVRNFVQKYGSTSEIVKKGFMAVVGMEREEVEIVRAFLEYPCLVPAEFEQDGITPLQCASQNGHYKVVSLLLANGARADTYTEEVRSPLHLAAERGHQNVIMFLVFNKADVNAQDCNGRTPLHVACQAAIPKDLSSHELYQLTQVVAYLLKNNAKLEPQDEELQTPLHIACKAGISMKIMDLLLQSDQLSCCIKCADKEGNSPLHLACAGGYREIIELLVLKGASLKQQNQEGNTPLHLAAMHCPDDLMKMLVKQLKRDTVSLYMPNKDGDTILHLASARGMTETVKKVLRYNAQPINSQNKDGKTSLHLACQGGFQHTVEELLQKANPNIPDEDGNMPLHFACHGDGFRNIIQLLVRKGADQSLKNKEGHTPVLGRHKDLLLQTSRRMTLSWTYYSKRTSFSESGRCSSTMGSSASAGYGSAFGESWNSHTSKAVSRCSTGYGSISRSWSSSLGSGTYSRKQGLTLTAAIIALEKCSKKLATDLKPETVTALFDLIETNELTMTRNPLYEQHQRAYNVLQHLIRKLEEKPTLFDAACAVLETETPTAANDLKVEYDKALKILQLEQACNQGNFQDIKILIQDYRPDSEIVQKSLMSVVTMEEEHLHIVKAFLESGVSPNITQYSQSLIQCACLNGYTKTAEYLLEKGADRQVLTEDKMALLHLACEKGHSDIVSHLLTDTSTDVNQKDKRSRTPLHVTCDAARMMSPSSRDAILMIAKQLLEHGAERDAQNEDGNTPLHVASKSGSVDLVKILVEKDPEHRAINSQNKVGNTPLHVAASAGFQEVAELLIQYDADPTIQNQDKKRPADIAGPSKLARLLSSQRKLDDVKSKSDRKNSQFYT